MERSQDGLAICEPVAENGRRVRARGLRGSERHEERVQCTPSKRNRERRTRASETSVRTESPTGISASRTSNQCTNWMSIFTVQSGD
jgi:hypothetical protein